MSCICICMYHLDWCHVPDRCLSQDFCLAVTVVSRRHPSIDYLFLCRIEQWLFRITHVQIVFIFENNFLWTFYFIVGQSCLYTPPSSWYNPRYLRLLRCWCVFLITTDALALASSSTTLSFWTTLYILSILCSSNDTNSSYGGACFDTKTYK